MKKIRNDIILVCVLLAIAVVGYLIVNMFVYKEGGSVEIYSGSERIKTLSLTEDTEYEINVDDHTNIIKIENGSVSMIDADCPDKLCEKQGKISKNEMSIICLPNKIVVKINSNSNTDMDVDAKSK